MGLKNVLGMLGNVAANVAGGVGMGMINDKRQLRQQEKLQAMQEAGNIRMGQMNQQWQKDMWDYTNYENQMKHMEAAGLNPALLYGSKGGGGATVGGGGASGVSGGQAPSGGGEIQGMGMMSAQLQLLKAQKDNIEADTANKQADTTNKPIQGKNIEAQTSDLLQGVENKKAQQELTQVETEIAKIEQEVKGRSLEDTVRMIGAASEEIMQRVDALRMQNNITEATWKTRVDMIKTELIAMALENELTGAKINTEGMRPWEIAQKIYQGWQSNDISRQGADQTGTKMRHDAWINDVSESTKIPVDVIEKILQAIVFKNAINKDRNPGYDAKKDGRFRRKTDTIK